MTWFRVDDGFARHPKVKALRKYGARRRADALSIWLLAGAECASALGQGGVRDGFVSREDLEELARPLAGTALVQATDALVEVGLWHREVDGFTFHDWTHRQPSSDKVKARRDDWRDQKAAQRERKRGVSAPESAADNPPDNPPDTRHVDAMSAAESAPESAWSPQRSPSRARAGIPARPDPDPALRDPKGGGSLDQVARAPDLSPAAALTRDAEIIRSTAQRAFQAAGVVPPPRAVHDLDGKPWVALVDPLRDVARVTGDAFADVAERLLAGFVGSERAKAHGYRIAWLVENPGEYLRGTTRTEPEGPGLGRLIDDIPVIRPKTKARTDAK